MKTKLLLVYGTLRRDAERNWNYQRFGHQHYITDCWIFGYAMHAVGGYPAVTKDNGSIFCELHEVDEGTYNMITDMELGAGYEVHEVEVFDPRIGSVTKASLYAMPEKLCTMRSICRIQSGDWNEDPQLAQ